MAFMDWVVSIRLWWRGCPIGALRRGLGEERGLLAGYGWGSGFA
jgi:hypothetical protein